MYERFFCVVPLQGKGTLEDPKRPMFAPAPGAAKAGARDGILGFHYQLSDDGKSALVEFVAVHAAAFSQILADPTVKSFVKGKHKKDDIEAAFKKVKKDFSFDNFGTVVLP